MASEDTAHEAPDGHGAFHLPPPSIWPVVLAIGIAILLLGLVLNLAMMIVGVLITTGSLALWVRDARREYGDLPQ